MARIADVERRRAVAAAQLQDVAEALGGDQGGPGPVALDIGIDDQRGAELDEVGVAQVDPGLGHAVHQALNQIAVGRQALRVADLAGIPVEGGQVREGAARIGGDDEAHLVLFLTAWPG